LTGTSPSAPPPALFRLDGGVLELKREKVERDTNKYVLKMFSTMSSTISLYTLSLCVI